MTTGPRVTRRSSFSPFARSDQWCTVRMAVEASKPSSANGRSSAKACTTAPAVAGRCRIISSDGSTATTRRSAGSYDPVPAPTFRMVAAGPSAAAMRAAIRASGFRSSE